MYKGRRDVSSRPFTTIDVIENVTVSYSCLPSSRRGYYLLCVACVFTLDVKTSGQGGGCSGRVAQSPPAVVPEVSSAFHRPTHSQNTPLADQQSPFQQEATRRLMVPMPRQHVLATDGAGGTCLPRFRTRDQEHGRSQLAAPLFLDICAGSDANGRCWCVCRHGRLSAAQTHP